MTDQDIIAKFEEQSKKDLRESIILDLLGMASWLIPLGGTFDFIYAPIFAICVYRMYRRTPYSAATGAIAGLIEELSPFDIIPTASIMWVRHYRIKRPESLEAFAVGLRREEQALINAKYRAENPKQSFWTSLFKNKRQAPPNYSQQQQQPSRPADQYVDYVEVTKTPPVVNPKVFAEGELPPPLPISTESEEPPPLPLPPPKEKDEDSEPPPLPRA